MAPAFDTRLSEHRRIWDEKPVLREIYADFHRRLDGACPAGRLLDIGGGSAHFKSYRPDIVSLDILPFPGIDVVADAHRLPFAEATYNGIVMLDVLHHLQNPMQFMREAARILKPGGRLAMIEPGMSALSKPLYARLHQEPVDMTADVFNDDEIQSGDDPFDSNQAIPTLMFGAETSRKRFEAAVPEMKICKTSWLSLFAYPLSGGFKPWCLVPKPIARPLLRFEDLLLPVLGPAMGFRLFMVVERR